MMTWFLFPIAILALPVLFIFGSFGWHHSRTRGLAYFGQKKRERERFQRRVKAVGRLLRPLISVLARRDPDANQFAAKRDGLYFPGNICNDSSLESAFNYQPEGNDVFVVTPMKSGTTWMQQLVYEITQRGEGDLSDDGHGHLFAVSPWLESFSGVPVDKAPLLGEKNLRVIKTHLPAGSCPFSEHARYIYVMRHPASCFASSLDFFRANAGEFTPSGESMLDWFCSDRTWWGNWPKHVAGFYELSRQHRNVLFITFEEMKADLPGVIDRVAGLLDIDLTEPQRAKVEAKSSFAYMKDNEEQFEMVAPGLFATGDSFFPSGSEKRFDSLAPEVRERIAEFVRSELEGKGFPLGDFYPDIAGGI